MALRACSACLYLSEEDTCPVCQGETVRDWQGFVLILDFTKSQIAEKMGFTHNGKYALKVR
jgi:DNA-directed RNA polymerase subunit E"